MTLKAQCLSLSAIGLLVASLAAAPAAAQAKAPAPGAVTPAASRLNLNAATVAQLDALPGIGPKTARLIVEYRQKNGGFKKIEELMNVRGVGEKNFLRLKDRITVGPATTPTKQP
ncbi:MAG TPA: helix-hairpin-helix domain-containing protein [Vicinamibacterales bacterium]|nr:helix-hairpin-helix domain-containing protein [Vicinamibacterales bacterium]